MVHSSDPNQSEAYIVHNMQPDNCVETMPTRRCCLILCEEI